MVRVSVARTIRDVEHLRPAWERLQECAGSTMFQSYVWNRTAAQVFGEREEPFVVYAESDSGAVLVPAAISKEQQRIGLLGDVLFDYRDVLTSGDPDVLHAAWGRLAQLGLPIGFTGLRGDPARTRLNEFAPEFFVNAPQIARKECDGEALAAAHRRLGRFWRRALRSGAELREYDGSASELVRWIYRQKAEHLDPCPENLFCDPVRVEFMVAVTAEEPAKCEIFVLGKDGDVMSALITFRDRDTRRFYTVFYDERFAAYSPGNILLFEICRRTLEQGMNCDMMTGEQPYKKRLATSAVPLFKVEATAETLASLGRLREPVTEIAA